MWNTRRMCAGGNGGEARNRMRVFVFIIFLTSTTVIYHYYDEQYPTFVEYPVMASFVQNYNVSQIRQEDIQPGFVVHSPFCQIPNISAYHESIKKYLFKWKEVSCSHLKPLTKVTFDSISRSHTLKVDANVVSSYSIRFANVRCCYSNVTRKYYQKKVNDADDDRYDMGPEVCFTNQTNLPIGTEYIYVTCSSKSKYKKVYQNIHLMVADKRPKYEDERNSSTPPQKYSVFLFGIDSISRLNFIRTLPKTMRFVEELGWAHLEGYTKIADNTFPNLIAILTGLTVEQLTKSCWKSPTKELDACPIIWKNFSQMSYVTAYAEDCAPIGSFNYHKYGFLNSPTDYYTRPIMMAATKKMKIKMDGGMEYCIGQYPQIEYLFPFMTEFVQRYYDRPHFSIFWANSYSHNELNMPSMMDGRIKKFLEDIKDYLNSTIVVFFSDHGMRFGKVRETYVGWLEERMPFIYFGLPPSFKAAYPEKYENLLANKNKLTSPFDLHATLQDILFDRVVEKPKGCPQCQSLFDKVPWNRSCEDAAITSHWCTCSVADESSSNNAPAIVHFANVAIGSINKFLHKRRGEIKSNFRCAVLNFDKIISVRSRFKGIFSKRDYVIVFQTKPNGGLFETTFRNEEQFDGVNSISRINMYGNQSSCVKSDSLLRLFCFCIKK